MIETRPPLRIQMMQWQTTGDKYLKQYYLS